MVLWLVYGCSESVVAPTRAASSPRPPCPALSTAAGVQPLTGSTPPGARAHYAQQNAERPNNGHPKRKGTATRLAVVQDSHPGMGPGDIG